MKKKVSIIGLGYVGLPIAVEFAKKYSVVGFDINKQRIKQLLNGIDITKEVNLKNSKVFYTSDKKNLKNTDYFIITVPTPVKDNNQPDFGPLIKASKIVGKYLTEKSTVIYESTVNPGATEDICIPILEKQSFLNCITGEKKSHGFFCGYSPERINPGDKKHTFKKIIKIISSNSVEGRKKISQLYSSIGIKVFNVDNIKTAEAAKIIENTQRDLNIAFINELSQIFSKMKIDTYKVLEAAATKWNFLNFQPGLVGGHCIGVDPYYLTYAVKKIGYKPDIILAGRKVNNSVPKFIYKKTIKFLKKEKIYKSKNKILIMGFTFKENCPDVRNTKVIDIYKLFCQNNEVEVYDPEANFLDLNKYYNIKLIKKPKNNYYDVILICVNHNIFKNIGIHKIKSFGKKQSLIFDVKNTFNGSNLVNLKL